MYHKTKVALLFLILSWSLDAAHSQVIIRSFPGVNLNDTSALGTGATPPDTMGAAGTNHFVEFINGAFAVYGKDGTRLMLISDIAFWENAGLSSSTIAAGLTDTRVTYDAGSSRWFASEITLEATGNHMLIARSDTSDPTGTWQATSFTATTGGYDYDTLGVDSNAVYLAANLFNASGTSYLGDSFFCIPKTNLLANPPSLSAMTRFNSLKASTYGFTLQPVSNPLGANSYGILIAIDDSFIDVDRTTVNNPGLPGATLSTRVRIPILDDSVPNPAEQPGGNTVDTVDDRFTGAVRQVGSNLFLANTILQGSRDAVHWLVLNEPNNSVVGEGLIDDPNFDYFQPTIAANSQGQIVMGFNRSGATSPSGDISIYGAIGNITGSSVTMSAPFLISQGNVTDFGPSFDSAPFRWGDYSATTADPTDPNLFWTIQEIPVDDQTWGTEVTLISLATNAPVLAISSSGTTVSITWPLDTDPAYVLESTPSLSPAAWMPVGAAKTVAINQNVVSLGLPPNPQFYRLHR